MTQSLASSSGSAATYTVSQLVKVAKQHGVDLAPHLPALNGHAHAAGRESQIIARIWVEPKTREDSLRGTTRVRRERQDDETPSLGYPPDLALRWCLAGDARAALPLWWKLQEHALARFVQNGQLRRRPLEEWRPCVPRRNNQTSVHTAELACIVIGEHGPTAPLFAATPMLRCWLLGITPRQWNRYLPRAHAQLTETLERWYAKGLDQVRTWILDGDPLQTSP